MKITSLKLRTLVIGLTATLLSPALLAQSLQVALSSTTPVSQAAPYKRLNVRFASGFSQTAYVDAILNYDSARFSAYFITSFAPNECRLVNNKITVTAQSSNPALPFPVNSTINFCQVWLKLKPGAATGVSSVYYSAVEAFEIFANYTVVTNSGTTITVQ